MRYVCKHCKRNERISESTAVLAWAGVEGLGHMRLGRVERAKWVASEAFAVHNSQNPAAQVTQQASRPSRIPMYPIQGSDPEDHDWQALEEKPAEVYSMMETI